MAVKKAKKKQEEEMGKPKKGKKEKAAKEVRVKKGKRAKEDSPSEDLEAVETDPSGLEDFDAILDALEKDVGLSSVNPASRVNTSTGLLSLDLMLEGGLVTGGWYTFFGGEQSSKSTLAMTQLARAAVLRQIPILMYFDFEGCVTEDTLVSTPEGQKPIKDLVKGLTLAPGSYADVDFTINSVDGPVQIHKVFYSGVKPITRIELENRLSLKGNNHPVLVRTEAGLAWKDIENIKEGDRVIVKKVA